MGSGYRTFTAGEVLTASNVQDYLQDQAVMVFAGTAARSSAIGTANFEEGMLTYLTDVDKLQVYTGATFADVYPPAASNQGLTLLSSLTFSAVSSVSLPTGTFSATYTNYKLVVNFTAGDSALYWRGRVAGVDNSSSNYMWVTGFYNSNSTPGTSFQGTGGTSTSGGNMGFPKDASVVVGELNGIFATQKAQMVSHISRGDGSTAIAYNFAASGMSVTTSYDSLTLLIGAGTMSGSVSVYGYNV
jgi:hypothetical protein